MSSGFESLLRSRLLGSGPHLCGWRKEWLREEVIWSVHKKTKRSENPFQAKKQSGGMHGDVRTSPLSPQLPHSLFGPLSSHFEQILEIPNKRRKIMSGLGFPSFRVFAIAGKNIKTKILTNLTVGLKLIYVLLAEERSLDYQTGRSK